MGVIEDSVFIATGIFASAIILVMGYYAMTALTSYPDLNSATADIVKTNYRYLDGVLVFGAILFCVASIILAYFIPSHPIFVFAYLLVISVLIILTPVYSNTYALLAKLPEFTATFDLFPYSALMVGNLPPISIALSLLIALVSYGKSPQRSGYGL